MTTQASILEDEAVTNQGGDVEWKCDIDGCERIFLTKMGLGQHKRLAHRKEQNDRINILRVKPRWSAEETEMMVAEEVKALKNNVKFMNQHLHEIFKDRPIEGIKGKRREAAYKAKVDALMKESAHDGAPQLLEDDIGGHDYQMLFENAIRSCINAVSNIKSRNFERLVAIADEWLINGNIENNALQGWLTMVFKNAGCPKGPSRRNEQRLHGSASERRKQEYAKLQKLYAKDIGAATRLVLASDGEPKMPNAKEMISFWKNIFESDSITDRNERSEWVENIHLRGIRAPITEDDIKSSELDYDSAAGPDGISVKNWRKVHTIGRALFYNLLMFTGSLPKMLARARTVLIPKKNGDLSPEEVRPLSITSVVVRQIHRIFATRFRSLHNFDGRQKAFIDCDGTMENLTIVSAILADAKMERKAVHMATLDLKKAFDSVSHTTIMNTITEMGCPKPFIEYVECLYQDATTILQYEESNTLLSIKRGVLQGDPISPLLFNAVIDKALKNIRSEIGYRMHGGVFNCIAYADDIILVSSTRQGLQTSLDQLSNDLSDYGLQINHDKTNTISMVPSGREKKIKIIDESWFKINNVLLKQIGLLDIWKYLGVHFEGTIVAGARVSLGADLEKLDGAPLKPQQKLKMLKSTVIPRYLHRLILGRVTCGKLKNMDMMVRKKVRKWLRFPQDSPLAYFYTDVKEGGLGLQCLAMSVPLIKKARLEKFLKINDERGSTIFNRSTYIMSQIKWCEEATRLLRGDNDNEITKKDKSRYWKQEMLRKNDISDLVISEDAKASSSWIYDRSDEISGQDYVHYHHIRIGCLPSRSRTSRGRDSNIRSCRAGCRMNETNYHTIQQCIRTHGGRIQRHDRVVRMISDKLKSASEVLVDIEPKIRTTLGLRKPDIIYKKGHSAIVIDVQIVSGRYMRRDRLEKQKKYSEAAGMEEEVKRRYGVREVLYEPVTVSYKGIYEKGTAKLLDSLDMKEHFQFLLVTSVLRGSWLCWRRFNEMTAMGHRSRGRT